MTIRSRIALQFAMTVGLILVSFSSFIYLTSAYHRQTEFYERLRQKARTTARLLVAVRGIDRNLLKAIDRNTLSALLNEKVLIFDEQNKLVYASIDDQVIHYKPGLLSRVRQEGYVEMHDGDNELVGVLYDEQGKNLVVLASAFDEYGKNELNNLRRTLLWTLVGGIALTVALGVFFAGQSLRPLRRINEQVQTITASNLRQRLDEGKRKDEIDQLAVNFNAVLQQLERAFEQQRNFVSHASHELRTPLAALKSEIQLGMRRRTSPDEHEQTLANLLGDTDRLITLTNSLLFLARAQEADNQLPMTTVRLEEVVFTAREELLSAKPHYQVLVTYDTLPENDTDTHVPGNEELLKRVLLNLFDNACKYSADQTARVRIATDAQECRITVQDQGIGIDAGEVHHVFEPFFRATNAVGYQGFGIGLSICQRIMALHRGTVGVDSRLGEGSTFSITLPRR